MDGVLTEFDIYVTENGLVQVSNDVRRKILDELTTKQMSLSELAVVTKRAQSTLSVHLDKMVSDGLVKYTVDKRDSRKKIYFMSSKVIATSKKPDREAMEMSERILAESADDSVAIHRAVIMSMILGADGLGMSLEPMFGILGSNLAKAVMGKFRKGKTEDAIEDIKNYFERIQFGTVSVYTFNPLTVIVKGETKLTRSSGAMVGMFSQGFFLTVLNTVTDHEYVVTDDEIFGDGNNYYRMVIEPSKAGSGTR